MLQPVPLSCRRNADDTSLPARHRPAWNSAIKTYYDAVTREPVPAQLQILLAQLAVAVHNRPENL